MENSIIFIKLGGSLITDKHQPYTPAVDTIERLASEILDALRQQPSMKLVIGHGSGSFGHVPAKKYQTRQGVHSQDEWQGFVEVWKEARQLNHIMLNILLEAGLPVISFPASSSAITRSGKVETWSVDPILQAIEHHLIPLVYGDVVFDRELGGTILSTEEIFHFLNEKLSPQRILIAGKEAGVWQDYPKQETLIREITPQNYESIYKHLGQSSETDVTGGMLKKVSTMFELIQRNPSLQILIFSGEIAGQVKQALLGKFPGTLIHTGAAH